MDEVGPRHHLAAQILAALELRDRSYKGPGYREAAARLGVSAHALFSLCHPDRYEPPRWHMAEQVVTMLGLRWAALDPPEAVPSLAEVLALLRECRDIPEPVRKAIEAFVVAVANNAG